MNKIFKTVWSPIRRQFVVTNETHASRGKSTKSAAAVAAAALLLCGSAAASYVDPGVIGSKASWETAEYQKDWGLGAMKASSAYAIGFHGQGVAVGVMDSGALLQAHPELAGDRFHASHNQGAYGSTGNRYPQGALEQFDGTYEAGEKYDITGDWVLNVNDSHGTHVTGTVGANRDGSEFHGVAWGSDVHVGNTGGTDDSNYGPFLDYQFFRSGWGQLAQDLIAANGVKRGGVINNSFGTNTRVVSNGSVGADGYSTKVHLPVNTVSQSEYEYFMFKQMYGEGSRNFVDAAYDAVAGTNVVQTMTTGNRDMKNPYYRALYPYFNPEAEKHWIAVAGLKKSSDGEKYELVKNFNEAGLAKWWTVVGPGNGIYSSAVVEGSYVMPGEDGPGKDKELGDPTYASWGGTSMAAPHVSGAMAVLMSRYADMSAVQVRDVLFTTATHKNADGSDFEGWMNTDGTTPAEGEVSDRMGWGLPDLEKGMFGPGQLLGRFEYDMSATKLDVWSNDISQVALEQREREDLAWKAAAEKWLANPTLALGSEYTDAEKVLLGDVLLDTDDDLVGVSEEQEKVAEADAIKWRKEYYEKRLAAIKAKIDGGLYNGSLVKQGSGTLVMTGRNTYTGGTTVEGGTLLGFSYSFGTTESSSRTAGNGRVTVNGGSFGVISSYNDRFTGRGTIQAAPSAADVSVDVTVNEGGKLLLVAGQDASVGTVTMKDGSHYGVAALDTEGMVSVYQGEKLTGTLSADAVEGLEKAVFDDDYAFFNTKVSARGGTLTAEIARDEGKTFASYAGNANARRIAAAAETAGEGEFFEKVLVSSAADVSRTFDSLSDDAVLNTRNASIVNGMTLLRAVKDQAMGIGSGRTAELAESGLRVWATGVGSWSSIDYGQSDMDSDFYAGLIGAEMTVCGSTRAGVFFGAGTTENKAGRTKVESDDIHAGLYGITNIADAASITYGIAYTNQDADTSRTLHVGSEAGFNAVNGDADLTQVFAEAAWTGFNTAAYTAEPYFAYSWIHAKSDGFTETVGGMKFETSADSQNVHVTTLGVRGAVPFELGSARMALKGDLAWSHFFGDTEAEAQMKLVGSGVATLRGGELSDMATVGLGLEAQVGRMTTFGFSYTGAYDGDITSHGISANVKFIF